MYVYSYIIHSMIVIAYRCNYYYDAFGNLDQKNCTTGSHRYLVDPFGAFGGDIIAEVRL